MSALLSDLGADLPLIAAPIAGGPSTPELVTAAARAGGLGFLAGGNKPAQALAGQIPTSRAEDVAFGVNPFLPNPVPVSREAYGSYARQLRAEADTYGLTLPGEPIEDRPPGQDLPGGASWAGVTPLAAASQRSRSAARRS